MPKIAIISGCAFESKKFLKLFKQQIVKTMYGNVLLYVKNKVVFLPRHGKNKSIPPHRQNDKANICALNLLGVEKIFAINSVGSLKESIKLGTFIVPDDYVHFDPDSFFEFELKSIAPELDAKLRKEIIGAAKKANVKTKNKVVYIQTKGPRFETKAEIKIIKSWGDVVGMTMANEATLAQELGIPYACICLVDNFAHGIGKRRINEDTIRKTLKKYEPAFFKIVNEIIKRNKN